MSKINVKEKNTLKTHQGAVAQHINSKLELRRSVMSCMLWENEFYEDGVEISERIKDLIPKVSPDDVVDIAVEAREKMKLRHVPLLIIREMARIPTHKKFVSDALVRVIQRADEITEFLAIYWKDGKQPISAQVKKGLAEAISKFNEYQLAKYNHDSAIKLRDVLFMTHAKPSTGIVGYTKEARKKGVQVPNDVGSQLFSKLVSDELETPDTWEVNLSSGKNKKETFERLIKEKKLGALALLRNLRNMTESGVNTALIEQALESTNMDRVLPFRFLSAARATPNLEDIIEKSLFRCISQQTKLSGTTILIVDVSGSMYGTSISARSELTRADVACSLAVLIREICENPRIFATAGNDSSMIHATKEAPSRRGFALRDAIHSQSVPLGGGGIFLKQVIDYVRTKVPECDRIIVITDEQDCDRRNNPLSTIPYGKYNYVINVASAKNGIGYGKWTHIDGWSEAIIEYIRQCELLECKDSRI